MRFLRKLVVNTMVVVVCAMVIEASGLPVSALIRWGGAQVASAAEGMTWPAWADVSEMKELAEPMQGLVDRTSGWVDQVRDGVKW